MDEEEYERHLENLQANGQEGLDYGSGNQYLSDEMRYTDGIIRDDVHNLIEKEKILDSLFLKRRTVESIRRLSVASTSFEIVLNNYTERDVRKETMGVQKNTILMNVQLSNLEKKYIDADAITINNEVHHRTKVLRGKGGFERGIQKTNIVKSTAKSILGEKEKDPAKSGISRYVQGGRK